MKRAFHFLGLSIFALGFAGCSADTFPKYSRLNSLRILALINDTSGKAEVSPGDTVTLKPWVSDVSNSGTLTYSVESCVDFGVSYGGDPSCTGNATRVVGSTGTISTLNAGNSRTAEADNFTVSVPATILATRSSKDQYNGVNYLVIYRVASSSGPSVTALKRILVSSASKGSKNSNPGLTQILANGSTFASLTGNTKNTMSVTYSAGSEEAYTYQKDNGSMGSGAEEMVVTWFISDGTMKYERTVGSGTTVYTTPSVFDSSRPAFVVAVVRDGRGGTGVLKATVNP